MMKAVSIATFGEPEVLQVVERPVPDISGTQLLIKVIAAGINRPDIFQRKGNYPAPAGAPADIPGLEVAGYVVKVGEQVSSFREGDKVMALLQGGGYAEYAAAESGCCLPMPDTLSFTEAASLPENLYTVWHNVFERGGLCAGERFLVHGGSGGIGYTAVQLAKLHGAEVFTTVGTEGKRDFVRSIGADHIVLYKDVDFEEQWKDHRPDIILDSVGGAYFDKNFRLLREDGRLVYINAVEGAHVQLNLFKLMQKRIMLTGSTLRSRDVVFKSHLSKAVQDQVMPYVADRRFTIKLDRSFDLEDVVAAHAYMESGGHAGKIVLKVGV